MIANGLNDSFINPLLFAFIVAALVRILQGSSTVAMITAAGITAPVLIQGQYTVQEISLIVIAIASGATNFHMLMIADFGGWGSIWASVKNKPSGPGP